ncbi:phosphoenolpyruvate synthase [Neisseria gonorrhoeae]|uniref:Phosphoenolpyruvate synthase n=1 Tax=Neisseria gonorrhoeae TaxID=485 RepID=A0A378VZL4_NEIGO|nr:phosphoenolpyruvate synthase [Neisseria gonorrhoeae]
MADNYVIWFENLRMTDVERVGGKNASLGEMISQLTEKGVRVPGGFATTADAYRAFLAHNGLNERISAALAKLDVEDVSELARVGKEIRQWILDTPFPNSSMPKSKRHGTKWLPMPTARTFPLPYALPQPPKTCPTHHLPANRKPS